MKRLVLAVLAAALAGPTLTACGPTEDGDSEPQVLNVYAASSLKTTFEQLATAFEQEHDGVEVAFSFAGSSDLVAQIQQGAPADVFASADEKNMAKLGADAIDPQPFATNTLEIAVPHDNPARITSLADLAKPGINLVTCAPAVPCGAAAAEVEATAQLDWKPVSEEQSVADVLGKVSSGEADAGLVYVTDVAASDSVHGIAIPDAVNAANTYPIAALEGSDEADLARAWVDFVLGATGQQVLADAGFGRP